MSNLQTNKVAETLDSRDVAEMVEKQHSNLMRDIHNYVSILADSELNPLNFFVEGMYLDAQGKERPCYQLTKMGCEFVANKMTGNKGVQFTAKYVQKFNDMEHNQQLETDQANKQMLAEAKLNNSRARLASVYLKLADVDTLSSEYKNIIVSKATETLSGERLLPYVKSEQKTYSATELGEMFGVKAQKIGAITNKHNLKTDEYGEWYRDKSRYSSKEVDAFRYFDSVIPVLEKILGARVAS